MSSGEEDHLESTLPGAELTQILTDIAEIVTCLFRLSVSIRNPAPHDRYKQTGSTDASYFEPFDVQHARDLFPSASEDLVKRLGQANSYRRQYFKYRELHHLKLSQGLGPSDHLTDPDCASTVASSIPQNMKGPEHHAQNAVVLGIDACSEDGMSQTSCATTVIGSDRLRIPPLPVEAESGPFQCPYCYMMIDTPSPNSWKYESAYIC